MIESLQILKSFLLILLGVFGAFLLFLPTGISAVLSKEYEDEGDNRKQLFWTLISMILLLADFCVIVLVITKMCGASSVVL
jgi:heme/copper-type cytochrome/quinol oxidase subunit 2